MIKLDMIQIVESNLRSLVLICDNYCDPGNYYCF